MAIDTPKAAPDFSGAGPVQYTPAETRPRGALAQLLAEVEAEMLAIPGVISVGIGTGLPQAEGLVVGVLDADVAARLPSAIKGVPLVVTVTGPVDALPAR